MKKIKEKQLDCILEAIGENTNYEIETNGYQDYDVIPVLTKNRKIKLLNEINKILEGV